MIYIPRFKLSTKERSFDTKPQKAAIVYTVPPTMSHLNQNIRRTVQPHQHPKLFLSFQSLTLTLSPPRVVSSPVQQRPSNGDAVEDPKDMSPHRLLEPIVLYD